MAASKTPSGGDSAFLLVLVIACGLLRLFFDFDWGQGVARAVLLVLLGVLAWRTTKLAPRPVAMGRPTRLVAILLALAVVGISIHLTTAGKSIHRSATTQSVELDQGQISYRAARYLIDQGVNPYSRDIPLDTTELGLGLNELFDAEVADQAVEEVAAALEAGAAPDVAWEKIPQPDGDPAREQEWQELSERIGYKYGPLQLVLYTPAVALFGHAGIYVVHLLLYIGIVVTVIVILRRWWPGPAAPWAIALLIVHFPRHIAHNALNLSATDLLPMLGGLLALLCFLGGRGKLTALFIGLSIAGKVFPGALYLPLLLAVRPRHWWPLLVVLAATYGPFLAWDPQGLIENLVAFNFIRSTDSTALMHFLSPGLAIAVKALAVALIGFALWRAVRAKWTPLATVSFLLVAHAAAFLAAGTFHNNYLIWATPLLGIFLALTLFLPTGVEAPECTTEAPRDTYGEMTRKRWLLLLCTMIPLVALPWTVDYWPGQDDPNHLALTHILQHHDDPDTAFSDYFTVNRDLTPYKLYYYLLLFFSKFMDLADANRIVVSAVIAALPLTMLFWLRRIAPERQVNVFPVCLLATSMLPLIGFHAYMISFLLGIAALALATGKPDVEGVRQPPGWAALLAASALLFIGSIAHPVAPVIIGAMLFVIEAPGLNPKAWLRLAVVGTPAIIMLGATSIGSPSSGNAAAFAPQFPGVLPNINILFSNLRSFDRIETLLRLPVLVALISAGVLALRRNGFRGQHKDQCLARLLVVFAIAFFTLPNFPALNFIPERMAFLLMLVAALLPLPCWARRRPDALCGTALILSLTLTGVQFKAARSLSTEVAKVVEAGESLPRNAKVLPLMFEGPELGGTINPLRHAWGYLVLERDIITPYFFANSSGYSIAGGGWRPVSYSQPFGPDYMLYVQESLPETMVKYGRFVSESGARLMRQLIMDTMAGYERVILIGPPEELVDEVLETMETESQVGDVWVLRQREDKAGTTEAEPDDQED